MLIYRASRLELNQLICTAIVLIIRANKLGFTCGDPLLVRVGELAVRVSFKILAP